MLNVVVWEIIVDDHFEVLERPTRDEVVRQVRNNDDVRRTHLPRRPLLHRLSLLESTDRID